MSQCSIKFWWSKVLMDWISLIRTKSINISRQKILHCTVFCPGVTCLSCYSCLEKQPTSNWWLAYSSTCVDHNTREAYEPSSETTVAYCTSFYVHHRLWNLNIVYSHVRRIYDTSKSNLSNKLFCIRTYLQEPYSSSSTFNVQWSCLNLLRHGN